MPRYNPAIIEPKWQQHWEQQQTFATPRLPGGKKLYVLDMFPYPSGDGLHVGHPEGYTATDIVCRYHRMRGRSVMHPMGWDAFGLPAEQHAIKTGTPPRVTTERNIGNFRRQLKMLGFSYDWHRELATTDETYFRWTQKIFLVLFDTWYDQEQERGRPISELPIPDDVRAAGEDAVRHYQDEHRLAYQSESPVNWCPALGTVLANEEVIGGLSERGGHPVQRIPLRQWMLRITAYADRLQNDLESLAWPESIKSLQRNWIGRSTGAEVDFFLSDAEDSRAQQAAFESWKRARAEKGFPRRAAEDVLRIYTTRPDTLFGATYMVMAPEHPYVERLTTAAQRDVVQTYAQNAATKSDLDRTELAKEKTGVFTGAYAYNPVSGQPIPIWIADYVLMGYGTGAIMAVPAHDTRDFEFAQRFNLPVVPVVDPGTQNDVDRDAALAGRVAYTGNGTALNSGSYDGLPTADFKSRIAGDLEQHGQGRAAVNYKLRDWLFSRQHFWGEPFPVVHELDEQGEPTGFVRTVAEEDLPVRLPEMRDFKPHGRPEPPWAEAPEEWLYVTLDGRRYMRETNTMPQWAGSCWYYLRYLDPQNDAALVDPQVERAWMPVDLYIGGAEHAVLHLLYARFWHKVLFDRGYVSTPEPFARLVNQGIILGEMEFIGYRDTDGAWISAAYTKANAEGQIVTKSAGEKLEAASVDPANAVKDGEHFVLKTDPQIRLVARSYKMSKSRGNVVNPDAVVEEYGADALRLYEMFMGPLEATKPWSMAGVSGVRGFLERAWRLIVDERSEQLQLNAAVQDAEPSAEQLRVLHRTIEGVTRDIESLAFNTAIAKMMEFVNHFTRESTRPRAVLESFVLLLSPFAPHLAEELWQLLGHSASLAYEDWPVFDPGLIKEDTIEIPVQVNGKVRARVQVPAESSKDAIADAASNDERLAQLLEGKTIVKTIVVPGRLVNFVVR